MLPATRPPPGPAAKRRRSREPAKPADLGYGRPSCEPRTANVAPSLPVRSDAGRRPRRRPRTTAARRPAAPDRGAAHHTEPLRGPARPGQRGSAADTGDLSVRTPDAPDAWTPEACPSGHLDTGCPLDRLDGRPHGGTVDADRATTGLASVRTSSRPATIRWAARPCLGHGAWERSATQDGHGICAAS
jgi:hypothetical protein